MHLLIWFLATKRKYAGYKPWFPKFRDVGSAGKDISEYWGSKLIIKTINKNNESFKKLHGDQLPGAQRDIVAMEDDEGHGAAMLSLKSQVKLKPVELSKTISVGRLRSKHPAWIRFPTINIYFSTILIQ